MKKTASLLFSIAILFIFSCGNVFTVVKTEHANTRISGDSLLLYDSSAHYLIAPYKNQLQEKMSSVIGITNTNLVKELPEGTLNNLMTDAALFYAVRKANILCDVCVMNYGGIRIPRINAGEITMGKVYELMPFDNQLTILKISGNELNSLLQNMAAKNGWPISGVKMKIKNGVATDILIQQKPIDTLLTYTIITSDYIANGGDKVQALLKPIERIDLGYLVRDAIIDYIKFHTPLNMEKDGRITVEP
jgi:2',3'-cyclic-nucleotide 2'-phosphodiesterase (5'-nucleotidase family)